MVCSLCTKQAGVKEKNLYMLLMCFAIIWVLCSKSCFQRMEKKIATLGVFFLYTMKDANYILMY